MEKTLNENIIQLQGRATLEEPLTMGSDYNLMIAVNCHKEEKVDLQDNKYNVVYKVKPTGIVGILDDKGDTRIATTKMSLSKQMKMMIERYDDYETCMVKMLKHPDKTYEFIKSLD